MSDESRAVMHERRVVTARDRLGRAVIKIRQFLANTNCPSLFITKAMTFFEFQMSRSLIAIQHDNERYPL